MRKVRKYKKIFTQGYKLLKYIYYLIYSYIFKEKISIYKNVWLISERGVDARDNGYFFYKYLVKNHPDIDVRYIISRDSPDFNKIKKLGKYIIYGSPEHYKAFINSKLLISSHMMGFSPDMGLFMRLQRYNLLKLKGKLIWLQHGVTKDRLPYLDYKKNNLSLFITASPIERDFIIKEFKYNKNIVKYTGFSRFDDLKKVKSNRILFMPTHRIYIHNMSDKEFMKINYYRHINSLINNKELIELLDYNNLTFILYVHFELQKYSHLFKSISKRIIVAYIDEYDVQELLINSCLLITDYSSVFFDYVYMEKPVIYYQFDYDEYRLGHYKEGYFNYIKDGFGPVVKMEDDVIKNIKLNVDNNFIIDNKTKKKIDKYLPIRDKNNCKRIYEEIKKLEE